MVLVDDSSLFPAHVLSDPHSLAVLLFAAAAVVVAQIPLKQDLHHQLSAGLFTFLVSMSSSSLL